MEPITLVKLGGSIITDKSLPYTLRPDLIRRLARELKQYKMPLVLAHGAGSFAHTSAKKFGGMNGYVSQEGLARVAYDAMYLNSLVMNILLEERLPVLSFRPLSFMLTNKGKLHSTFFSPIEESLHQGFIPVVYGDIITDLSWKTTIFSGEKVLSEVMTFLQKREFKIKKIIEIGITNGVYDSNHQTLPLITSKIFPQVKKYIQKSPDDVTGGMLHKIQESLKMAKLGISTEIINGTLANELSYTLEKQSKKGTLIQDI